MATRIVRGPRTVSAWNHVRAVLLLPVMNTVIIPSVLLWLTRDTRLGVGSFTNDAIATGAALLFLVPGISLIARAISLFVRMGEGTLAPWDPTQVLITGDIYRFSRNPMKAGLFLVLIGEAVLLRSGAIAIWASTFIAVNTIYIRWFEERGLRLRFGSDYEAYCRDVPRWLPLSLPSSKRRQRFEGAS